MWWNVTWKVINPAHNRSGQKRIFKKKTPSFPTTQGLRVSKDIQHKDIMTSRNKTDTISLFLSPCLLSPSLSLSLLSCLSPGNQSQCTILKECLKSQNAAKGQRSKERGELSEKVGWVSCPCDIIDVWHTARKYAPWKSAFVCLVWLIKLFFCNSNACCLDFSFLVSPRFLCLYLE